ncbi:MAG: hypothetical protein AB9903_15125 [Vulcanimicrobiota bacterium]
MNSITEYIKKMNPDMMAMEVAAMAVKKMKETKEPGEAGLIGDFFLKTIEEEGDDTEKMLARWARLSLGKPLCAREITALKELTLSTIAAGVTGPAGSALASLGLKACKRLDSSDSRYAVGLQFAQAIRDNGTDDEQVLASAVINVSTEEQERISEEIQTALFQMIKKEQNGRLPESLAKLGLETISRVDDYNYYEDGAKMAEVYLSQINNVGNDNEKTIAATTMSVMYDQNSKYHPVDSAFEILSSGSSIRFNEALAALAEQSGAKHSSRFFKALSKNTADTRLSKLASVMAKTIDDTDQMLSAGVLQVACKALRSGIDAPVEKLLAEFAINTQNRLKYENGGLYWDPFDHDFQMAMAGEPALTALSLYAENPENRKIASDALESMKEGFFKGLFSSMPESKRVAIQREAFSRILYRYKSDELKTALKAAKDEKRKKFEQNQASVASGGIVESDQSVEIDGFKIPKKLSANRMDSAGVLKKIKAPK